MANFNDIVGLTKKWEGGLSNNPKDRASKYPSPYIYKGKKGWHTNKGVTYQTFESASKKLGFENNATNFINMPDEIWNKIAKSLFWDKLGLDGLQSNGVAFQLFSWQWGAGQGWFERMYRYLSSKGISWDKKTSTLVKALNKVIQEQGEIKTIQELTEQQNQFYKSLNQPAFTKGWLNRVADTTNYAIQYVKSNVIEPVSEQAKKKSNWLIYLSIGLIGYYLLFKAKKGIRI